MFIDTPFNKDCPHHKLYFTTKPERCPYCGALSHQAVARKVKSGVLWTVFAALAAYWTCK